MEAGPQSRADGVARLPNGGRIAYQIDGHDHRGVPVLLIRPLGGSMALWGAFRGTLAERFRVISYDYLGCGRSSHDFGWLTTRQLARNSVRLLDHLEVHSAHVFGLSLGGMVATWLAISAPERVARLCLAAAPACGLELSRSGLCRDLGLAATFVRARRGLEANLILRVLSPRFRAAHPTEVARIEQAVRADPSRRSSLLKHALAGALHDARADLIRISAPTLALVGADDDLVGAVRVQSLAQSIPGAAFEVIANCGHDLTLERPLVTANRVTAFFAPAGRA